MHVFRDHTFIDPKYRGASIAIGNFDGVHRGHQKVIDIARAAAPSAPLGILTFEPHPRQYFAPKGESFRLMNATARAHRLEKLGVERLYELNFNASLSTFSARAFAQEILSEGIGARHVTVGEDFRFGKGRTGNATDLIAFGKEFGFGVTIVELVADGDDEVSSSAIRAALSAGHPEVAARMLGHYHRIEGQVIRGDQRGRELGYPTANMSISGLHPPKFGVYVVRVDILTGPYAGTYSGAASMGVRPMFGENLPNLESYLFDFKGDIYGENISVALIQYLRPEEKFDGLEALIAQMDADCVKARQILAAL
ncbi:bifunctional riboflavin kinase/FAD synthetase [Falsihalocynthiibacter arcticus]|uniref:Riboflavin biosynthesis protein n=1 Tax=Falsihalocynthiibacter arcticus TaxID=1579316 RepID=A0A126UVK1_9RHOB|nr:bifunctional riboflavin kinase/FAD synthetase [Falsihalocynthiibacter arcticus]AML50074.1 bifunctional riboflavin kinase/FMN adenylyltransferase [Falsihalocynthiibacter arcticus]